MVAIRFVILCISSAWSSKFFLLVRFCTQLHVMFVCVCILLFPLPPDSFAVLCNLSNGTEETLKWIRWSHCCLFLLHFLVYCSSYSTKSLIHCLCSCTLANFRWVSLSGFNCRDGQSNCIIVQTCRPRSAPLHLCHAPWWRRSMLPSCTVTLTPAQISRKAQSYF